MTKNKILSFVIVFILVICSILLIDFIPKQAKDVYIKKNLTVKQIAAVLKENKIIPSSHVFIYIVKFINAEKKIKHGKYKMYFSLTSLPTIVKLVKGPKKIKVTIPEGFTTEQIVERLVAKNVVNDAIEFVTYVRSKNLDGFLFPETYFFYEGQPVEEVVGKMVEQFYKKYKPEFTLRAYEIKFTTYQVVILASIIEKEAKSFEEKQMVSAVFHNRLKKGWNLESCATVRYALKKFKLPLTYKDIQVDSKFNTYKHFGLPPAPICNPGIDSIKAVLYPAKTDAMFFYTPDNNTHIFSKYYKQHLERQKQKR